MNSTYALVMLTLTLSLAGGCTAPNDGVDAASMEPPVAAAQPQDMAPGVVDATAVQTGSATGTITALDPATSTVTIDHGPVVELQWPAMNMGFAATPAQVAPLEVGQRVRFDFEMSGSQATITRIEVMR